MESRIRRQAQTSANQRALRDDEVYTQRVNAEWAASLTEQWRKPTWELASSDMSVIRLSPPVLRESAACLSGHRDY